MQLRQHEQLAPSAWVCRFARLIPAGGAVLDLACGSGRHARYLAGLGYRVDAVDRDGASLAALAGVPGIGTRCVDLEGSSWTCEAGGYDGIVVANYLHRPLVPGLLAALRPGGVLIYETFALGNEKLGRPSNPEFLLRPHELLEWIEGRLQLVAFEQGRVDVPKAAIVQRICALRGEPAHCRLDLTR